MSEWVSERVSEYINDSYVNKLMNRSVKVNINILSKYQYIFISAYTFAKIEFY